MNSDGVMWIMQVLFNDTIFYNIQYGRISASKEEVKSVVLYRAW